MPSFPQINTPSHDQRALVTGGATDGDWEVLAGRVCLTASDASPALVLLALTPEDKGVAKGVIRIAADGCVGVQGGTDGVEIHNDVPTAPITLGGLAMVGPITLQQGPKKVVLDETSITVDGGGIG